MKLGKEVSRDEAMKRLDKLNLTSYEKVSIIRMMANPPKEPDMTKLAPIMNALFPDITQKIEDAYMNEVDVCEWTRGVNELLSKEKIDDQVRRDIIQATITYYFICETNNRDSLEIWIRKGGLR